MKSGIYCIENKLNGKKYIGQSGNAEERKEKHHGECRTIWMAIKKYEKENFNKYVILYCEEWELDRYETICIKIFHSHVSEWGYNVALGGGAPMRGRNHTDETKEKQRLAHLGKTASTEAIENMSGEKNHNYGKTPSDKTKEKMRSAQLGKTSALGRKYLHSSSKYFAVYKDNIASRWSAQFSFKGKNIRVGRYKTEIEAALAYDRYITEHNLNRPLNFPENDLDSINEDGRKLWFTDSL